VLRAGIVELEVDWPWPTLLVNLAGAFTLGVVVMYGRRHWSGVTVAGIGVGVLGAFTTFSTLAGETWVLLDEQRWAATVGYVAASLIGGVGAAIGGVRVGRAVR
jgi:CrcB protein